MHSSSLKSTVLHLTSNIYIHFHQIQTYSKFGYQALFTNNETNTIYQVQYYNKSVLTLNAMNQHLERAINLFKTLNYRKIAGIIEVIQQNDCFYVVSKGYKRTLAQLIERRQGLTQFEVAYFLGDLHQLLTYLRSRQLLFQKLTPNDLFLTQQFKLILNFSIFLNTLSSKPLLKRLPFRTESRNRNNCPDLFFKKQITLHSIDQINSWHMGIILYQIVENMVPFQVNGRNDLIGKARGLGEKDICQVLENQYKVSIKAAKENGELEELLRKLLKPNPKDRLKFALIIIQSFIKKFPIPPHILPTTVFSCPPSQSFKEQYFKKFTGDAWIRPSQIHSTNRHQTIMTMQDGLQSQKQVKTQNLQKDRIFKTQLDIPSQATLSQSFVMIQEFVDISDSFGFGYQMNTGVVGFVFNDQTELIVSSSGQEIRTRNRGKNKQELVFSQDKLPQEDQTRKKIHILQAFSKTLKRKKVSGSQKQRAVSVHQYSRTKYASMFLLTNDSIQVFFNDKVNFLLTKSQIYVQGKNVQNYQKFDYSKFDGDMQLRRDYCVTVAHKIFMWDAHPEPNILDTQGIEIDM